MIQLIGPGVTATTLGTTKTTAAADGGFQDRRRSEPRLLCDRQLSMIVCSAAEAPPMTATVTDCSEHGLGLLLPRKVEAGQQVLGRVVADGGTPVMLVYTIRYCIGTKPDQYRAGARFTGYSAQKFRGSLKAVVSSLAGSCADGAD